MSEENDDSKTEQPTAKRLSKAQEDGQVVVSNEIKTWFMLLAGTLLVAMMIGPMMARLKVDLVRFIAMPHAIPTDVDALRSVLVELLAAVGMAMAMPLALLMVIAAAGPLVQAGWVVSGKRIKPSFDKISPLKGLKRLFSLRSLLEFVKGLLKLTVVGSIAVAVVWPHAEDIPMLTGLELPAAIDYLHDLFVAMLVAAVAVMTVIAGMDYAYQKYDHLKRLRMSKQEVRDEHKQSDGDPMIKARLRQIRAERARRRMIQAVPTADVVLTNPTHYAVALKYEMDTMNAPRVVAKGTDLLALRIRAVAEEHKVPVIENPPLARALYASVEVDQEIPSEHYRAVAEIIGYVMGLKGKLRR